MYRLTRKLKREDSSRKQSFRAPLLNLDLKNPTKLYLQAACTQICQRDSLKPR